MGDIGQNLQLQSDGFEIVCAIRAPHKTYAYKILWQNISYFASYWNKWVCQTLQVWVYMYYNFIYFNLIQNWKIICFATSCILMVAEIEFSI